MSVQFNHVLLAARDRQASASFFAHLFGLPEPTSWGPLTSVSLTEGVHLQCAEPRVEEIQMQRVAFLVDDDTFDQSYTRIQATGLEHGLDPQGTQPGQMNTHHGGRGV
ncbi:hypothetical protein M1R55_23410 (plasmid) [Deinococcus sp. QL22]|nr:hypothetical protein [Deinococcus sp. QL22]UQN09314.1 hypothetical protein M1R55_22360 [Deinococcus sp. QL22]UQN09499.1 hypothetical protein M1R55_23410 [Deinococcus sp. QL22]